MENKFVGYCESYLITKSVCQADAKCCVSRDDYSGKKTDLRTPLRRFNESIPLNTAELISLINKTDAKVTTSKPVSFYKFS